MFTKQIPLSDHFGQGYLFAIPPTCCLSADRRDGAITDRPFQFILLARLYFLPFSSFNTERMASMSISGYVF